MIFPFVADQLVSKRWASEEKQGFQPVFDVPLECHAHGKYLDEQTHTLVCQVIEKSWFNSKPLVPCSMAGKGDYPRNLNHPRKGASIKVEPIRDLASIAKIKALLFDKPRDLCLFTFGINTAYRAGEILSLTIGQVAHLKAGDRLDIRQSKTSRYRPAILNGMVIDALNLWIKHHPDRDNMAAPVFVSGRTRSALCVSTVNNMIKRWCRTIGLKGNYGSHSMRKTWGYQQRVLNGQSTPILMVAFGHSSEAQTLDYLCVQQDEIAGLYDMEL